MVKLINKIKDWIKKLFQDKNDDDDQEIHERMIW